MHTTYKYIPGATPANILTDLIAILTGETNPANLSADCDQANTTISTAVSVAGWTVHDAAASATSQVIKAPYADNGAAYKYLELKIDNYIETWGYETFDETGHVGTNKTGNTTSSSYYQSLDISNGGIIHLFSSPRFIAFSSQKASSWGGYNSGISIAAEHTRNQPWNTVASGYPAFSLLFTGYLLSSYEGNFFTRVKDVLNADLTGSNAKSYIATSGCSYNDWSNTSMFPSGTETKVYNDADQRVIPFMPIELVNPTKYSVRVGDTSTISNIWIAPRNLLANLETVTKEADEYIAFQADSNGHRILFPKG